MSKRVVLSCAFIQPKDLVGNDSFGMALVGSGYPQWWPKKGEDVHVVITEAHMITKKIKDAVTTMCSKLETRGCSCTVEFETGV